ncbi:hypothetical protein [Baaleninema simplex]|uniref:hypothetical protein n=1 Tax=Baaleninema simplex TaxID=2862350 RepID=UPI0003499FC2|nr:hypothetical protein [Baaleninema simplex]
MGGGIYLIQDDEQLVEMSEQSYESEEQLQELLETYPNLLAGDQIDTALPRHWLLVKRETPIPSEEDGTARWSLDRLFIDQNAIPTLVEVRRVENSRVRQEIIGQMLDYAANASIYWPVDTIVSQFETNCRELGRDPEQVFEEFLGTEADEERFWQKVKTHLQAGKLRLVFVADVIPSELRRVVEFLNEQVDPAEVLAIELKQYTDREPDNLRMLVPRVLGQTAEARLKKSSATRERRRWDETSFFQEFEARRGREEAKIAGKIYEWAKNKTPQVEVQWGKGDNYGGFVVSLPSRQGQPGRDLFNVGIWGGLEISSQSYGSRSPFDDPEKWNELRSKFSSIGMALPTNPTETRFPNLRLSAMQDELTLQQVLQTFAWVVEEVSKTHNS